MLFKKIHPLIHEYDFPVHDYFLKYKEDIVNQNKHKLDLNLGYQNEYQNRFLNNIVTEKFLKIVEDNYIVSKQLKDIKMFTYMQDNKTSHVNFHNHQNTATINATFFIDPPRIGGEMAFLMGEEKYLLKPKINKIYLSPYWIYHSPLPQKDDKIRISVNLEYFCQSRPKHKLTGDIW